MGNENKKRVECDGINSDSAVVLWPVEKGWRGEVRSKGTSGGEGGRQEEQREARVEEEGVILSSFG